MKQFYYTKENGLYYFYGYSGELSFMTNSVAIAFDKDSYTIHKHGRPELVHSWVDSTRNKLLQSYKYTGDGLFKQMANYLMVIESDNWPLEDLNKVISNTGYLKLALDKLGVDHGSYR